MDHMVCLDEEEGDLEALRSGKKTMVALGMNARNACGTISEGDGLLFAHHREKGMVLAKASAAKVLRSPMLSQESCAELLATHAMALALTGNQVRELVSKKFLVLVELRDLEIGPADGDGRSPEGPARTNIS